jgi:hypothetical protein
MSSHWENETEVPSSTVSRVVIGNARWPSLFTVNDHRLRAVTSGITPATVELPVGSYEIRVYSEYEGQSLTVRAVPGSLLDCRDLGVPVDTDVPVACAMNRSQFIAEKVTIASSALRDSGGESGLAIIGLERPGDSAAPVSKRATSIALLNAAYQPLPPVRAEFDHGVSCWQSRLEPGGYVVRLGSPAAWTEIPVWLSSGFQTILFLPSDGQSWLVDRASVHMLPANWVWTGFDQAARFLEFALKNMRQGRRPFGDSPPDLDIPGLCLANPVLGLIRLHDLLRFSPRDDELDQLASQLSRLIPEHPDLLVTVGDEEIAFPPLLGSGLAAALANTGTGTSRVVDGSLLEATYERMARVGPWSAWSVDSEGIPHEKDFSLRPRGSSLGPIPLASLVAFPSPDRIEMIFKRSWNLITGFLAAYRLSRRPTEERIKILQHIGEDAPARRIARYIADLLLVGQSHQARNILTGFGVNDMVEAFSLPRSVTERALSQIRARLAYGKMKETPVDEIPEA